MVKPQSTLFSGFFPFTAKKLPTAIACALFAHGAWAAPEGGEVVGGEGSISQSGKETVIDQASERLAIDWQSFNVGADERVEFKQPGQSAIALNRILGRNGSEIMGRIDANGHVMLINPNGILFGKDSVINTGGLVASGLAIDPEDFINGDLVFEHLEGTDGTVINTGMLNASLGGNVTLLGKQVDNQGYISAELGRINLAAGKKAVLTFDGAGLLGVEVDEAVLDQELEGEAAVKNSGQIRAKEGQILLTASTARDVFSQAVNDGGQEKARSVTYHEDGSFSLGGGSDVVNTGTVDVSGVSNGGDIVALGENIRNSGSITADSETHRAGNIELHAQTTTEVKASGSVTANAKESGTGGDIILQGKNVGLFDNANIEATGVNGGGEVLIGGDQEGLNPQVRNAEFVYTGDTTTVDVSATAVGDGGKLITFAEDTTRIYGSLAARGGEMSGDGGFIETSGKKAFKVLGAPNISAPNGIGGHWLIDPYDIDIVSRFGSFGLDEDSPFTSSENMNRLESETIVEALKFGDVTVQTGGEVGDDSGEGNITVSYQVDLPGSISEERTLNFIAHNDILIDSSITASAETSQPNRRLNLNLQANKSGNQGSISLADGVEITTAGGDFTAGEYTFFDGNGIEQTRRPYNVDFSGATIDVIGAYSAEQIESFFPNATGSPDGLAPSGRIAIEAQNDIIAGVMQVKGRERETDPAKIHLQASRDIVLAANIAYDNNPTEVFAEGDVSNNGFTTLELEAGRDVYVNGDVTLSYPTEDRDEHQDRLHFYVNADQDGDGEGDVLFGVDPVSGGDLDAVTVMTAGGDFVVENAVNVDFADHTINTSSRFGGGDIAINASGNVAFGAAPLAFVDGEGNNGDPDLTDNLRAPNITVDATDITLNQTLDYNGAGSDYGEVNFSEHPSLTLTATNNLTVQGIADGAEPQGGGTQWDTLALNLTAEQGSLDVQGDLYSGGADITLDAATLTFNGNDLNTDRGGANVNGTPAAYSPGGDIALTTGSDVTLGGMLTEDDCTSPCGNLTLAARSDTSDVLIDDGGALLVNGVLSIDLGQNNDVDLDQIRNPDAGADPVDVRVNVLSARDVALTVGPDSAEAAPNPLLLQGQVSGDLDAETRFDADISQASAEEANALLVAGSAEFNANENDVLFNNPFNDFQGHVFFSGAENNVTVADANALVLGQAEQTTAIVEDLTATAGGAITQAGALNIGGLTTLSAGDEATPANITLDDTANQIRQVAIDRANDFTLATASDLQINRASVSGDTTLTANTVTQLQALVLNTLSIDLSGALEFGEQANEIAELSGEAGTVDLQNAADLALGAITVNDSFDLNGTAYGLALTLSDGQRLTLTEGSAVTTTGNGDILLNASTIQFGEQGDVTPAQMNLQGDADLDIQNVNNLSLWGAINGGAAAAGEENTLTITATAGDDTLTLGGTAEFDNLDAPTFNAGAGADTFNLHQGLGLTFNGEAGADIFNLLAADIEATLNGGDNPADAEDTVNAFDRSNTWDLNADGPHTLNDDLRFRQIEIARGGGEQDRFNIASDSVASVNGAGGDDEFFLQAPGLALALDGGNGTDPDSGEAVPGADVMRGDDSDNQWQLAEDGNHRLINDGETATFTGMETLQGNTADDDLRGSDANTTWLIASDSQGTVTPEGQAPLAFEQMNRFTAGSGDDTFTIAEGGSVSNTLDGGEGADTLIGQNQNSVWALAQEDSDGQAVTVGSLGAGENADSATPYVNRFQNFEQLQGGSANDRFAFTTNIPVAELPAIAGGAGQDFLSYAAITEAITVETGGNRGKVTGIEVIEGNADAEHTLTILDPTTPSESERNDWLIDQAYGGDVTLSRFDAEAEALAESSIAFSGFQHLQGGAVADHFVLTDTATTQGHIETLTGGGLGNTLSGKNQNSVWTLNGDNTGALGLGDSVDSVANYVSEFNNIQTLTGGTADDIFAFSANVASDLGIHGGAGQDFLSYAAIEADITVETGGIGRVTGIEAIQGNADFAQTLAIIDPQTPVATDRNAWTINAANTQGAENTNEVRLIRGANETEESIHFFGFSHLQGGDIRDEFTLNANLGGNVLGAGGADTFALSASQSGRIDGGTGADAFALVASDLTATLLGGEEVDDNSAVIDTLTGPAGAQNTWQLNAEGNHRLDTTIVFSEFESLQGGEAGSTFVINTREHGLTLRGTDAEDAVDTLDYSGLDASAPIAVSLSTVTEAFVDAVTGSGAQTLWATNEALPEDASAEFYQNHWAITDNNAGTLAMRRGGEAFALTYSGFSHLQGQSAADVFALNGGSLGGTVNGEVGELSGPSLRNRLEQVSAAGDTLTWTVERALQGTTNFIGVSLSDADGALIEQAQHIDFLQGGAGDDTFAYQLNDSGIGAAGGSGTDTADFSAIVLGDGEHLTVPLGGEDFGGITDVETLIGQAATAANPNGTRSDLLGPERATEWTLTGQNSGQVSFNGGEPIAFAGFDHLLGGNAVDTFTLGAAGAQVAQIQGGSGTARDSIRGFAGEVDALWTVNTQGEVTVARADGTFTWLMQALGMEQLQGSDPAADTFAFQSVETGLSAVGGDGPAQDSADFSQVPTDLTISLGGASVNNVTGVEKIVGNNPGDGVYSATLTGPEQAAEWGIDGLNQGRVTWTELEQQHSTAFEGFSQLNGQDQADRFALSATISGGVSGGGGADSFVISADQRGAIAGGAGNDSFELSTPEDVEETFTGLLIDRFDGGSGRDTFTVNTAIRNADAQLLGGEDNDTFHLRAGTPGDVSGGAGADTFNLHASLTGRVLGEAGDDRFNLLAAGLSARLDGGGDGTSAADGENNTLTAYQDAANYWVADADGSAVSNTAGQSSAQGVRFEGMHSLVGAASYADTFAFNRVQSSLAAITAGDDGIDTLDYSGASETVALTLGAGGLSGFEKLVGNGAMSTLTGPDEATDWTLSDADGGRADWGDGQFTEFRGFAHLQGGAAEDTFDLQHDGADSVAGGGGSDRFEVHQALTGDLSGGSGADSFNLRADVDGALRGEAGSDTFAVLADAISASIVGGEGDDELQAFAGAAHVWRFDDLTSGRVWNGSSAGDDAAAISFGGIDTAVGARERADRFVMPQVLNNAQMQALIPGAGGGDTLDYSAVAETVVDLNATPLNGFERLVGDAATTELSGWNGATAWEVNQTNAGMVTDGERRLIFEGVPHLVGGTGDDTFALTAMVATIDGGGGTNTADLTGMARELRVDLGRAAGEALNVARVHSLSANGDHKTVLRSTASVNQWQIDDTNSGQLTREDSVLAFTGFNHLQGDGDNTFILAENGALVWGDQAGQVRGGPGQTQSLTAYDRANTWRLEGAGDGTVTAAGGAIKFVGLNALNGGSQRDEFVLHSANAFMARLAGHGGTDSLSAFANGTGTNLWAIDDSGGNLQGSVQRFTGIEAIVGHAGKDDITLAAADMDAIDTRGGADTLTLAEGASLRRAVVGAGDDIVRLNASAQLERLEAGAGDDDIAVADTAGLERLLAGDGADRVRASGRAVLNNPSLGTGADTLQLSDAAQVTGLIDGGEPLANDGVDELDFRDYGSGVTLGGADSDFAFTGIEALVGARGQTNTLYGADGQSNEWVIDGENRGRVNALAFSGFGNLIGGDAADLFRLNGDSAGVAGRLDGAGGDNALRASDRANTWTITDSDSGSVTAVAAFERVQTLIGGARVDYFLLSENASVSGQLDGAGGRNTLALDEFGQTWTFDRAYGGHLGPTVSAFENIHIAQGGSADDTFILKANGRADALHGDGGDNRVNLSALGEPLTVNLASGEIGGRDLTIIHRGIQSFIGPQRLNNTLVGVDSDARWRITGENAGELTADGDNTVRFEQFAHLRGRAGEDTFVVAQRGALSGGIDGGATRDGLRDSLRAYDHQNTWIVEARDSGRLSYREHGFAFANINHLIGGEAPDTVTLSTADAAVSGEIRGGDGLEDRLQGAPVASTWTMTAEGQGSGTGIGQFDGFERLQGNTGADTFILQGLGDVRWIDGGGGANSIDLSALNNAKIGLSAADARVAAADLTLRRMASINGTGNALLGPDATAEWRLDTGGEHRVAYTDGGTGTDGTARDVLLTGFNRLTGGNAADTFVLPAGLPAMAALNGGGGDNTLISQSASNTWRLDGRNRGVVGHAAGDQRFENMQNLTGGSGRDELELRASPEAGLEGLFDAGGGDDEIVGYSGDSEWDITGRNEGRVALVDAASSVAFVNTENLAGREGVDRFRVALNAGVGGWIDGGAPEDQAGGDVLDMRPFGTQQAFTISYNNPVAGDGAINIRGIERIQTQPGHQGTLLARDEPNTWRVVGVNTFILNNTRFSDFASLKGGSQADEFIFYDGGRLTGLVDGSGGENTLRTLNFQTSWAVSGPGSGRVSRVYSNADAERLTRFTHIQQLVSGDRQDRFMLTGSGRLSSMSSGAGEDVLQLTDADHEMQLDGNRILLDRLDDEAGTATIANVEHLVAGAGDDVVTVVGESGLHSLVAGAGQDRLDTRAIERDIAVNLQSGETTLPVSNREAGLQISAFERFQANPARDNRFTAPGADDGVAALWRFSAPDAATIEHGEAAPAVAFSGFNHLVGSRADERFELQGHVPRHIAGGPGNDTLSLGAQAAGEWQLNATNRGQWQTADQPALVWQGVENLIGSAGADRFTLAEGARIEGVLDGGAGEDTVSRTIGGVSHWALQRDSERDLLAGYIEAVDGDGRQAFRAMEQLVGAGEDRLIGPDTANQWHIDAAGGGRLEVGQGQYTLAFQGFAGLSGGAKNDAFHLADTAYLRADLHGGAGSDVLEIEQTRATTVGLRQRDGTGQVDTVDIRVDGIESLHAQSGFDHRLLGPDASPAGYRWVIDGPNSGRIEPLSGDGATLSFYHFSELFGGQRPDQFSLTDSGAIGLIDGGAQAQDLMDYSAVQADIEVVVGADLDAAGEYRLNDIEGVKGNNAGSSGFRSVLRAGTANNTWTVNDTNAGRFEAQGGDSPLAFLDFSHLVGGDGVDRFQIDSGGRLSGAIAGGEGRDRLDAAGVDPAQALDIALQTGLAAADFTLREVETVIGHGQRARLWGTEADDNWQITDTNSGRVRLADGIEVTFSAVAHLAGRSGADVFTMAREGRLSGWLSGGAGEDRVNVGHLGTHSLVVSDRATDESVPSVADAVGYVRADVERLLGNPEADGHLVAVSTEDSLWQVDRANAGRWRDVRFFDFAHLRGGEGDDEFAVSGAGALDGLLDGGGGENRVVIADDISLADGAMLEVSLGRNPAARLQLANIVHVRGAAGIDARLWGGAASDNAWRIDGQNRGQLNDRMAFQNFSHLRGGAGDDRFALRAAGEITGTIDGGAEATADQLDMSLVEGRRRARVNSADGGFEGIEQLIGNGQLTLVGPDRDNRWQMSERKGAGRLDFLGESLSFTGVANLQGGPSSDRFALTAGLLTGTIDGGAGDDVLALSLPSALPGADTLVDFAGGGGRDRINMAGNEALSGVDGQYQVVGNADNARSQIALTAEAGALRLRYDQVETVEQYAATDTFAIKTGNGADSVRLTAGQFALNERTPVRLNDLNPHWSVDGDASDRVTLEGEVAVAEKLSIHQARIDAGSEAVLRVPHLHLNGVRALGSAEQPVATDIATVSMNNTAGTVAISELDGLTLGQTDTRGEVWLAVGGDLTQNAPAVSEKAWHIDAGGALLLEAANQLSGPLHLLSQRDDVRLNNASATQLASVQAQNLHITSAGAVTGDGPVGVNELAHVQSAASINLAHSDNQIQRLRLTSAGDATLSSQGELRVIDWTSPGSGRLNAQSLTLAGPITAGDFEARASDGPVSVAARVAAETALVLSGEGVEIGSQAALDASVAEVDARGSSLQVNSALSELGNADWRGRDVAVNATVNAVGDLQLTAARGITVDAAIDSETRLSLDAQAGDLTLTDNGSLTATTLSLASGGDARLASLAAETINVNAAGLVQQTAPLTARSGGITASARRWTARGVSASLNTDSGDLQITASEGMQAGEIRAGGDIRLASPAGLIDLAGRIETPAALRAQAARGLQINAPINAQSAALLAGSGDLQQNADIASAADLSLATEGGRLSMVDGSESRAGGELRLSVGGTAELSRLASETAVAIDSQQVVDGTAARAEPSANIVAPRLRARTTNGLGESDAPLHTRVASIDAVNARRGVIDVRNRGPVTVNALHNRGDIRLRNDTDVNYSSGSINGFYRPEQVLDPRANGRPSNSSNVVLISDEGSFQTRGDIDLDKPAVAGSNVTVISPLGDFGGPGLPPVFYAPESVLVAALRSWNDPLWAFGVRPERFTDNSQLKTNLGDIGAGEQLVEVESLEEIDPAIFTSVRNFFYKDVSIRLPRDQLFEDELEREPTRR